MIIHNLKELNKKIRYHNQIDFKNFKKNKDTKIEHSQRLKFFSKHNFEYPSEDFTEEKGIVICAGGLVYIPGAIILIKILKKLNCSLPIEVWYLDDSEMDDYLVSVITDLGAKCVNASLVRKKYPVRHMGGWEIKCYSVIHSNFRQVLFIDADNIPTRNPTFLFDDKEYIKNGMIYWSDREFFDVDAEIFKICDIILHRKIRKMESGQMVINKEECWEALQVTMHLNEYSDFYYKYVWGDKDTFQIGCMIKKKNVNIINITPKEMQYNKYTVGWKLGMMQPFHDGTVLFQHRGFDKFSLFKKPKKIYNFLYEKECIEILNTIKEDFSKGRKEIYWTEPSTELEKKTTQEIIEQKYFLYKKADTDSREIEFLEDYSVDKNRDIYEEISKDTVKDSWTVKEINGELSLLVFGKDSLFLIMKLKNNIWEGTLVKEGILTKLCPLKKDRY